MRGLHERRSTRGMRSDAEAKAAGVLRGVAQAVLARQEVALRREVVLEQAAALAGDAGQPTYIKAAA